MTFFCGNDYDSDDALNRRYTLCSVVVLNLTPTFKDIPSVYNFVMLREKKPLRLESARSSAVRDSSPGIGYKRKNG